MESETEPDMPLAVLADNEDFGMILTMYFPWKEKSISGQAILILSIMFHMFKQT